MTTRTTLRRDLADLKEKVYMLGKECLEISDIYNSILDSYSNNFEEKLIEISNSVKNESKKLHEQCFLVLTLQQPLIKDLRFVIGTLQIILNLEKISEQYLITLPQLSDINTLEINLKEKFIKMARSIYDMLKTSITLYLSSNINTQNDIIKTVSEISYLHDVIYKQILKEVAETGGEKAQIEAQLLNTVRVLEKIADLILNLTEQVNYIIIGNPKDEK